MKNKLAKVGKRLTSYVGKKCRAFMQHVASGGTHVPASTSYTSESIKSEVADDGLAEGV